MAEFNKTCPACADGRGIPRAVLAARGMLTVTLACDKCGHNWDAEGQPDFDFLRSIHDVPPNDAPALRNEDIGRQAWALEVGRPNAG